MIGVQIRAVLYTYLIVSFVSADIISNYIQYTDYTRLNLRN